MTTADAIGVILGWDNGSGGVGVTLIGGGGIGFSIITGFS